MRIFEIFEILKPTLNLNFSDEKFPKFSIKIPFFYRFFPFFRLFFSFYNDPGKGERRDLMHYTLYWKNLGIKTSLKIMHIIRSYDEKTFDLHSGTNWFWWSWIENEFSRVLYFISNSITAPAIFCLGVTLKGFIESTGVTFWQIFLWRELEMVENRSNLQFFQMKYKRYFSQR